jgi:hypothetical protein
MNKLLLLAMALAFVGCAARRHVRVAPLFVDDAYWSQVTPKKESEVIVTEGDLKRKYKPIATVFVDSIGREPDISFARMKKEGAKIGADAVIKVKVSKQSAGHNRERHFLEGLAVVFEKH